MVGYILTFVFAFAAAHVPSAPVSVAPGLPHGDARVAQVVWSDVESSAHCWFFSGPNGLGRDHALRDDACVIAGPTTTVAISGYPFRGPGQWPWQLDRRSSHTFNGQWDIVQRLRFEGWDGTVLEGHYRYDECEPSDRACTNKCVITARVSLTVTTARCDAAVSRAVRLPLR